jgi:hypothetical protein
MVFRQLYGVVPRVIIYACCCALLFACAPTSNGLSQDQVLPGDAAAGAYIDLNLGEQHITLMPTEHIFQGRSANLSPDATNSLAKILNLLKKQTPRWVAIMVVSAEPTAQARALSAQQADALVHYVSAADIGTRMVYATRPNPDNVDGGMPGIRYFAGVNRGLSYIVIDYGY